MTKIKFTQPHIDTRTLASEDLKKVGVEGFTKRDFVNGQEVEVDEEVATALLENGDLFGQFEAVEDGASTLDIEEETEAPAKVPAAAKNGTVTKEDAPSASAGTTSNAPVTGTKGNASTK